MTLKLLLQTFCTCNGTFIRILDSKSNILYHFDSYYFSKHNMAVYDDTTLRFNGIDVDLLNCNITTWGVYHVNNNPCITIYVNTDMCLNAIIDDLSKEATL